MKSLRSHNNKTLLFRFVTSYSMIIILILVLGLFFLFSIHTSSKEYTYRQNYTLFKESTEKMDSSLRLLSTLTTQIGSNTSMKNLSNLTEVDMHYRTLAAETMNYLTDIMSLQSVLPVESFYVYLPETDYFISPTLFMDTELFYHFERSFKRELYEDWYATLISYDNDRTLIPLSGYHAQTSSYLYKIPLSPFYSESYLPAIACFELKLDGIRDSFQNIMEAYSLIYITDETNTPLVSISDGFTPETPLNKLTTIVDLETRYATQEFREHFRSYTITKIVSSYNGWQYYLIQPSSYLLDDLTTYQITYLFVILLFCGLTYVLIYQLSKANIKPYEAMTNRLETSRKENLTLQDALQKQKPLVYSAYVSRIMKGYVAEPDVSEINDFLQIKGLGERHFFVLYINVHLEQLEHYTKEAGDSSQNRYRLHEYENELYRSFYQYFGSDILIYHPDVNSFALLLSSERTMDDPELTQEINDIFTELHDHLLSEHSLWIFGGLGETNTKLPYFWKSYQQALEAVSYAKDENSFIAYRQINRSNELYYYPFEMAQQLTSFIQSANSLQIVEIFKLLRRENTEYRSLSSDSMEWLLSDLRTTLIKIRYSLEETPEQLNTMISYDAALQQEKTLDGMEHLALELSSFFKKKPEGNQLIASIKEYLNQNYFDASLSLKKISDEFSISESYFSYLFKTETGQNFSEYLEELRMAQALILIRETDTPLSELYSHLGYNNPNSFRRAFKKVYGDSPKAFRTFGGTESNE